MSNLPSIPWTNRERAEIRRRLLALEAGGGGGGPTAWVDITGKPSTFPPSAHSHVIADVTGLQTVLDGKQAAGSYAAATHGHSIADTTGLQTALDGKQSTLVSATNIKTVNGNSLLGSGDLVVSGGGLSGLATVTPTNNQITWSQTVAAAGVTAAQRIMLTLGSHDEADENDAEMLDVAAMSAAAGTDQITFELAFSTPVSGPIKINWMAV